MQKDDFPEKDDLKRGIEEAKKRLKQQRMFEEESPKKRGRPKKVRK